MTSQNQQVIAYLFAGLWGIVIGWFYSTEVAIYSLMMPSGQESELSGLYQYCGLVLSFFPPMIVTFLNESDVDLGWACVHINIYLVIALLFYQLMPSWNECLDKTKVNFMKDNQVPPSA